MRIVISHSSTYHYEEPVPYGLQELRLTPRSGPAQRVIEWATRVEGGRHEVSFEDQYANRVDLFSLTPGATETTVVAEGEVETVDTAGVLANHAGFTPVWLYLRRTPRTEAGVGILSLMEGLERPEGGSADLETLHGLASRVGGLIVYEHGHTHVASTAEEALAHGRGVCQDHAHVFIAAARRLGFPARYVSGYLLMEDVADQDASHAWAEAWVEDLGWVGFDIANGISPDERYVRVATGLDYQEAAPVSGVRFGAGGEALRVSLQIQQ